MFAKIMSRPSSQQQSGGRALRRHAWNLVAALALVLVQPFPAHAAKNAPVEERAADIEERLIDLQVQIATMRSMTADGRTIAALENEVSALTAEASKVSGRPSAIQATATTARTPGAETGPGVQPDPRQASGAAGSAPGWFGSTTVTPNPVRPDVADPGRAGTGTTAPVQGPAGDNTRGEILPGNVFPGRDAPGGGVIAGWANPNPAPNPFAGTATPPGASVEPAPGQPQARPASDPETEYQTAYGLLLQQDFGAAQTAFVEFVSRYPDTALAGNAQYWIGETLYARGAYKDAAVAFLKGFEKYGDGNKGPDSLLKLALSMAKLNQTSAACSSLRELASRYSRAPAPILTRGKDEMRKLRCPAG